jgi:small subunit ribosomal protein S9
MATAKGPKRITTVGKRKTSIARIFMSHGQGKILINGRDFPEYFGREALRYVALQPLDITGTVGKFDISANLVGGGPAGQADALKGAISKALLQVSPDYRRPLKSAGLLTRDARIVERKKYGRRGARKRSQYSKR